MATTTSLGFPNMFSVAQNTVNVLQDNSSVVSRTRLLILTEPTELYNSPQFGVGLRRHLWKYNKENEQARVKDRIVEQVRLHEPCVVPERTSFASGLALTESFDSVAITEKTTRMDLTIGLVTTYGAELEVKLNDQ